MRIALDVSSLLDGHSGIGFYVERLTAALVAAAPEHEFLLTAAFWSDPARLETAPLPRGRNVSLLRLTAPQRLLLPAEEAIGLLWRERRLLERGVDVLHGLGNTLPPLRRLPGVVTIHHVDGPRPPGLWYRFFFGMVPRRSARRAAHVIADSESTRRDVIERWGVEPARATTIHAGGPDPVYRPAETDSPAPKVPYILHVGVLTARKNVPALMRAFGRIIEKNPERPLRLLLAGRPGDASNEATLLAAQPPLSGRVEMLGFVPRERLIGLYQHAAAVVVPSSIEGFGFPVLEAMACGVPVLVANAASLPEIAGDAALVCDASRIDALAAGLARIIDDRDLAAELRRKGPARAASFSWETAAKRTLEVLKRARTERRDA